MGHDDFTWGVGLENCWMAQLDRPGVRLLDVFLQMGHYERWQEELELVRDLGVGAVRYSVPWYRSEPAPGRFDWEWISRSLEWLKQNRIIFVIDLIHYGTPTWMDNGVLNHAFPERLDAYAEAFARKFAELVATVRDHPMELPGEREDSGRVHRARGMDNSLNVTTGDLRRVPTKAVDAYRRVCARRGG